MELDDLKARWEVQSRKLETSIQLNQGLFRESVLGKAATALTRLRRLLWVELLINVGATFMLGGFIADHVAETRFLIPALALQLGVIVLLIESARQLAALSWIDYSAPIIAIQQRLESLRAARIRAMMWTLLLAPLAWTPLFIVAMKGLFDVDVYNTFGIPWLAANVLFGMLVIAAGVWVSRRYADRLGHSAFTHRLLRDIGGQNLAAASSFLNSLSQFENERT